MVQQLPSPEATSEIIYPDRDGQPMSDNILQFQWIVTIKENLELMYTDNAEPLEALNGWISPRLQIQFSITSETLEIYRPDGSRFLTFVEIGQQLEDINQQLEESQAQAERLAARLRELGVDPASI